MREDRLLQLADLASGQWGLFTSGQAVLFDVGAQALGRWVRRGSIERLRHGVYRLAGVPHDPRTPLRAAWLALEPSRTVAERHADAAPGVVSHRSAAWLHGLGDLDADEFEFVVGTRRQSRREDTRYRIRELPRREWVLLDGLPITTVLTTVRDLARTGLDGGHLADVVRDALVGTHLEVDAVAEVLQPLAERYGAPAGDGRSLVGALLDQAGVPRSVLDTATAVSVHRLRAADAQPVAPGWSLADYFAALAHLAALVPRSEVAAEVARAAVTDPAFDTARRAITDRLVGPSVQTAAAPRGAPEIGGQQP